MFRGAGWNVIKVIWGRHWDPLLARDRSAILEAPHDGGGRRRVPDLQEPRRRIRCASTSSHTRAEGDGATIPTRTSGT